MKRTVGILIVLFLILSLGATVYIVSTNRAETRTSASTPTLSTVKSGQTISDWCGQDGLSDINGSFVSLEVQTGSYDQVTGVQIMEVKAKREKDIEGSYKIPIEEPLTFYTREEGCSKASVYESSCGKSDSGFYQNTKVSHEIPAGRAEISWQVSLSVLSSQRMCGHMRQTVHLWDVTVSEADTSYTCNTAQARGEKKTHGVLYVVTQGPSCRGGKTEDSFDPQSLVIPEPSTDSVLAQLTRDDLVYEDTPNDVVSGKGLPVCTGLSASPTNGTAPLAVSFIGSATDTDGEISLYEFIYGDGNVQRIERKSGSSGSVQIGHTYKSAGEYSALLRVRDNSGNVSQLSDICRVGMTVDDGKSKILGTAVSPTLPPIGGPGDESSSGSGSITSTPTPTGKAIGAVSSATPSATPTATVVAPDVPVAGSNLATVIIGFVGMFIIAFGLLFAL